MAAAQERAGEQPGVERSVGPGRGSAAGRSIGLVAGVCGFASVLSTPLLAQVPLRHGIGLVVLALGLGALLRRRDGVLGRVGAAAVCLGLALLLAGWLHAVPGPARRTLAAAVLMAAW